jgi:Uma2 family endonuclease
MSTVTRITVADYDRMIAEGYFPPGPKRHRVELIDGELLQMSPIGPLHEEIVDILNEWSMTNVPRKKVRVRIQNSIGVPALDSAPEPDVVWVERKSYRSGRPRGNHVFLIIEVSDSSLAFDRGEKANMFAAAGIEDYWVVNIPDQCVEVFRQPKAGKYASHRIIRAPDVIHPLKFARISLNIGDLFSAQA